MEGWLWQMRGMRDMKGTIVVKKRKCQTRWKDDEAAWSDQEYQSGRKIKKTLARDLLLRDGVRKVVM